MQDVKVEAVVVRRSLDNAADAVSSTFPKGKQHGCFSGFLDITHREFHKSAQKDRRRRPLLLS